MISRIDRFITDVDHKEHTTYIAASEHILELCREMLDKAIMATMEGKELPRAATMSLVQQMFPTWREARALSLSLYAIYNGVNEDADDDE